MAAGLYTKNNLSELGLNATDAVQKLYGPQVQQDLLLFAFASRLESIISSPTADDSGQIYGLVNEPISDSQGNVLLRTKFVTQGKPDPQGELQDVYTYSDNNLVWFDKVPTTLDKRTVTETYGAPIKVSVNGSIVATSAISTGNNYFVIDSDGNELTLPAQIDVRVRGITSGATDAVVRITVKSDGTIDQTLGAAVVTPGSGYIRNELLDVIPGCGPEDDPTEDACLAYNVNTTQVATYTQSGTTTITVTLTNHKLSTDDLIDLNFTSGSALDGNYAVTVIDNDTFTVTTSTTDTTSGNVEITRSNTSIRQNYFVAGEVSRSALLQNELYTYRVLFADRDGFFLYDDNVNEYVYLGAVYDTINVLPTTSTEPQLVVSRRDELSSDNLIQLYNLNGRSAFWSYTEGYETGDSISDTIRNLSDSTEELRDSFRNFVQNTKLPALLNDETNTLGTQYNVLEGKSINSDYRVIFRDPDGVLDQPVYEKSGTYSQSLTTITVTIPDGHSLTTGDEVYLLFTSGTSVDGKYTITVTDTNNFTVTAVDSKTASGNVDIVQGVSFTRLTTLNDPDETSFADRNVPGVWLWTGEKYQRVFSSDEKAFISVDDKKYLSPAIYGEDGLELSETGDYKYSISASYLKPGTEVVKGFDTQLSVLIQTISGPSAPNNGGFVYHRTLSPDTVRIEPAYTVKAWPLFSYTEGNLTKDAKLLAI